MFTYLYEYDYFRTISVNVLYHHFILDFVLVQEGSLPLFKPHFENVTKPISNNIGLLQI